MSNSPAKRGDLVTYTDRQGVATTGRVRRVVLVRAYTDPSKVAARYYAIESVGVLVADGVEVTK